MTEFQDDDMFKKYRQASYIEQAGLSDKVVKNSSVCPNWTGDGDIFWYCRNVDDGFRFVMVDPINALSFMAFDHLGLANALSEATGNDVNPINLPIKNLKFLNGDGSFSFYAFDKWWFFDGAIKLLPDPPIAFVGYSISPDGQKAAYVNNHNLWLKCLVTGRSLPLTSDGQMHYSYATLPEARNLMGEFVPETASHYPEVLWSPDSAKIFTFQMDEREVRNVPSMLYVPKDGSVAPRAVYRKYGLPGDENIAKYRFLVIDIEKGAVIPADYLPVEDSFVWLGPVSGNRAWWSGDNATVFFVDMTRGQKEVRLIEFDTKVGSTRLLFKEDSDTYLELGVDFEYPSMIHVLAKSNEMIWFSERSGFGHLYLYDLSSGKLKNPITSGEWLVRKILHVDDTTRELIIQIAGRDPKKNPYYREIAKVSIDSGEITILAASNHDYFVPDQAVGSGGISPSGSYIVSMRSRVDCVPVSELRDRNGLVILTLETADVSLLPDGWRWPEPVQMKADNGVDDIYGVIFRPTDFCDQKKYPILDCALIVPFYSQLPTGAFYVGDPIGSYYYMTYAALAELGFIVTVIDGRGTPYRSKKFHDFGYDDFMNGGGIVDHIAGIRQLADKRPYMDIENVGLVSTDGPGNGAVFGLLNHSDFYKVGVAFSIWDPRLVKQGEVYHGIVSEDKRNISLWDASVDDLTGKLLLITGMKDQFFHSSMTFQLIDALDRANKDVDLILQPNGGHGWRVINAYRKVWDYLLIHLLKKEPPREYFLSTGFEINLD